MNALHEICLNFGNLPAAVRRDNSLQAQTCEQESLRQLITDRYDQIDARLNQIDARLSQLETTVKNSIKLNDYKNLQLDNFKKIFCDKFPKIIKHIKQIYINT